MSVDIKPQSSKGRNRTKRKQAFTEEPRIVSTQNECASSINIPDMSSIAESESPQKKSRRQARDHLKYVRKRSLEARIKPGTAGGERPTPKERSYTSGQHLKNLKYLKYKGFMKPLSSCSRERPPRSS